MGSHLKSLCKVVENKTCKDIQNLLEFDQDTEIIMNIFMQFKIDTQTTFSFFYINVSLTNYLPATWLHSVAVS